MQQAQKTGAIEVGKQADLIVLDQKPDFTDRNNKQYKDFNDILGGR